MSVTAIVVMLSVNVVALSDAVLSVAVVIAVVLSVTAVLQELHHWSNGKSDVSVNCLDCCGGGGSQSSVSVILSK